MWIPRNIRLSKMGVGKFTGNLKFGWTLVLCFYVKMFHSRNAVNYPFCWISDRMRKLGTRNILSHIRSAAAAQLFVNILCDAHNHWNGSYHRIGCHTGSTSKTNLHFSSNAKWLHLFNPFVFLFGNFRRQRQLAPKYIAIWRALSSYGSL